MCKVRCVQCTRSHFFNVTFLTSMQIYEVLASLAHPIMLFDDGCFRGQGEHYDAHLNHILLNGPTPLNLSGF